MYPTGNLSLVYQQNLRGSIQQIAFRMASLNFDHICSHERGFLFRKPHPKKRILNIFCAFLCNQKKQAFCVVLFQSCTFLKNRRQASILTPLARSKNWPLFGTISHTSKCLQVCRPSSETKLDSFSSRWHPT